MQDSCAQLSRQPTQSVHSGKTFDMEDFRMRLLRTPIQHIVIGEVIIDEGSAIMIRIKKPQTGIYEDITLGQLLTEMAAPLQGRTNAFLLTHSCLTH